MISTPLPLAIDGLVSFWDFQEAPGVVRLSRGPGAYELLDHGGSVPVIENASGPFGSRAAGFGGGPWLEAARAESPRLDLHGLEACVSIVAWIKRRRVAEYAGGCQALAGIWNEHGLRQYCLFLNLQIHGSAEQVGAHISSTGGATPGHKYCMDAAIGATPVPFDVWQCVAMTYERGEARAYLNGQLDKRGRRNPYYYPGGIFDGGPSGANFTVGAVARPAHVDLHDGLPVEVGHVQANLFQSLLGGLAVFERALAPKELEVLANLIQPCGISDFMDGETFHEQPARSQAVFAR